MENDRRGVLAIPRDLCLCASFTFSEPSCRAGERHDAALSPATEPGSSRLVLLSIEWPPDGGVEIHKSSRADTSSPLKTFQRYGVLTDMAAPSAATVLGKSTGEDEGRRRAEAQNIIA